MLRVTSELLPEGVCRKRGRCERYTSRFLLADVFSGSCALTATTIITLYLF